MRPFLYAMTGAALSFGLSTGALAQARSLEDLLKDNGYRLYKPIRPTWGPGTAFLATVVNNKIRPDTLEPVCDQLFADIEPSFRQVIIPDYKGSSDTTLSLGLSLLDGVIGKDNAARLTADYRNPRNVSINWGNLVEYGFSWRDRFPPSGNRATIHPDCERAVIAVVRSGRQKDLYVVPSALQVAGMDYTFRRGTDGQPAAAAIGGDFKVSGLFNTNVKAKWTFTGENTLRVLQPAFIAHGKLTRASTLVQLPSTSGLVFELGLQEVDMELE